MQTLHSTNTSQLIDCFCSKGEGIYKTYLYLAELKHFIVIFKHFKYLHFFNMNANLTTKYAIYINNLDFVVQISSTNNG